MNNQDGAVLPLYKKHKASSDDNLRFYERRSREEPPKYIAHENLIEVVNMAIRLRKPLLLEGEPGCGKTTLARHVAWTIDAPYYEWHVKSNSKARDGLYTFNAVGRLRDAQIANIDKKARADVNNSVVYVHDGPLGRAFKEEKRPAVVLIDEIDKAESGFPNDLLLELDRMSYAITEISDKLIDAHHRPLVMITSNREKALPSAFLRRCLYYYIEFPEDQLQRIIEEHDLPFNEVVKAAVDRFIELRESMQNETPQGDKVPDVAELLDWLKALGYMDVGAPDNASGGLVANYALLKTAMDRDRFG